MPANSFKSKNTQNNQNAVKNGNGGCIAGCDKQRFMEEILMKENVSRINMQLKNLLDAKTSKPGTSKQYEVAKKKLEMFRPAHSACVKIKELNLTPKNFNIKKVDPEKLALEKIIENIVASADNNDTGDSDLTAPMTSSREYGWWLAKEKDCSEVSLPDHGRKHLITDTFFRRNGVDNCLAL